MRRSPAPESSAGPAAVTSWVLFDWASQPFFTLITTFVYAPFFAASLAANPAQGQALWGYAAAASGLAIALASPVLGAIADASGPRKPWVAAFSAMLVIGSAALWFTVPGAPWAVILALAGFALASVGAEFATVFTNAMMPGLVSRDRLGRLSGLGWAAGYVGGLLSLIVVLGFLAAAPETGLTLFGLQPAFALDPATHAGDRAAGPLAALWYLVFVLPLFAFVPDAPRRVRRGGAVRDGLKTLAASLRRVRADRPMWMFFAANMAYKDALTALFAFGGIFAAGQLGWATLQIGLFGILLTVTGTAGALAGGWLDDRFGPKRVLTGAIALLTLCCLGIVSIDRGHIGFIFEVTPPVPGRLFGAPAEQAYLILGGLIGAAAGPLQAASRTLLVRLAPPDKLTEYFGLLAFSGKATSFIGPLSVASLTAASGSQRVGISIIIVLFALGAALLAQVPDGRTRP